MSSHDNDLKNQNSGQEIGVKAIRKALKTIPDNPGVYRMLGEKGDVLYVGKALNLKKRVSSYTRLNQLPDRLKLMVSLTASMEIVLTTTEAEALLLEANYIKKMKPRFNILLRDDKSFPWLMLTKDHKFPRLLRQRGKPIPGALYWGPFASAWAVDQTLQLLQRAFLLRTCSDSVLSSRSRPCLLYQIKRCSAPCVDRISSAEYDKLVTQAREFLSGGGQALQQKLTQEMEKASEDMAFERAALIRDRIRGFTSIRASNAINPTNTQEADVIAIWQEAGQSCVQVFFIRGGRNNGNCAFYPSHDATARAEDVLPAFIMQFYENKMPTSLILTNVELPDKSLVEEALTLKKGSKVQLNVPLKGEKKTVLDHAILNAREALERKLAESTGQAKLLAKVAELFDLEAPPQRIEVYDNSHIMGQAPYGVMIVGGAEGFDRRSYRKYSIKGPVAPGDDFGMMREVMTRRFSRLVKSEGNKNDSALQKPDLLLIDGGKGQVSAVKEILETLGITDIPLVGIAKGVDRNAGREWFFVQGKEPFQLPERDPVLYYLQRLRDEAHRFAITTHRAGRSKALIHSKLDDVPGIGAVRKKALLARFGSVKGVKQATIEELRCVPGINKETASVIYGYFHPEVGRS
ncbi:excinuclease ABC subunit UvrC [Aristophania vespae]|uniref:UvrABC system protein C n=1 Tax=Aristophania vespae TaxID=2697033 RepID=A0A6P1NEZ6_9PROT|nr:excinuclease ABC subunit UvrC [Aristophania vespae]QHI95457.1 excinuclease ABC subunit UvrC [Aristophania vespae]UMM64755.1 UvrABC system protein C [Aristophania vespae]